MADDIITRDDNGDLAVNVVTSTEGNVPYNYDDCFTLDTNGRRALRVVGAGGGDSHNKGYFATQSALEEAYPTGEAGDYAIVGSTDTVWIWDEDNSEWIDSDQKGQVTSVNNQTGDVTLTASDVGALPDNTHIPADPVQADWDEADSTALDYIKNKPNIPAAQVNSDWNANSGIAQILNKPTIPDVVQYSTMPTASADNLGKIVQFTGTTDANYTNGYFYKCVSDGQNPATYSWENIEVQEVDGLPSQTGQSGKFLTTDGTDASWSDKPLVNNSTGISSLVVLGSSNPSARSKNGVVVLGGSASSFSDYGISIGGNASVGLSSSYGIAIGNGCAANAQNAIQLSASSSVATNSDANTVKIANANGNYEIMSVDGTIPTDRFTTTPNVAGTYSATIVVDGQGNITRSWATAPDPLPSQTGNAGKVLMTNGTTASWEDVSSSPTTAPTLVAANWSNNQQTVNVTGVTATNTVIVAPFPTDAQDYATAGILCIGQGAGTLTFSCISVPANDLQVNVVII